MINKLLIAAILLTGGTAAHGQVAGTESKVATASAGQVKSQPSPPAVTQRFGERPEAYAKFGIKGHNGEDLGKHCGEPDTSPEPGTVIETGSQPDGYGNYIKILGKSGWTHIRGHYETVLAHDNQPVTDKDVIGIVGSTGNSVGCHVHWTTKPPEWSRFDVANGFGGAVDPERWKSRCLNGVPLDYMDAICATPGDHALTAAILFYENRAWPDKDKYVCSEAGACGIGQFIPATWQQYGQGDPHDWHNQINATANYLVHMKKPPSKAAEEYNCGPSCVMNSETSDYVAHVIKLHDLYQI